MEAPLPGMTDEFPPAPLLAREVGVQRALTVPLATSPRPQLVSKGHL